MDTSIHFKLEEFEGPLDLLLTLIEKQKLNINEIALSKVTEQYLDFVEALEEEKDAEDIANFLVIASRLLLLKSKTLLPELALDDEEDGLSLEDQLKIYRLFVEQSKKINDIWQNPLKSIGRKNQYKILRKGVEGPSNLSLEGLNKIMLKLIDKIKPPKDIPMARILRNISLKERIKQLRVLLKNKLTLKFGEMFSSKKDRTEVIITFLAILELAKRQSVTLSQEDVFGDILIKHTDITV